VAVPRRGAGQRMHPAGFWPTGEGRSQRVATSTSSSMRKMPARISLHFEAQITASFRTMTAARTTVKKYLRRIAGQFGHNAGPTFGLREIPRTNPCADSTRSYLDGAIFGNGLAFSGACRESFSAANGALVRDFWLRLRRFRRENCNARSLSNQRCEPLAPTAERSSFRESCQADLFSTTTSGNGGPESLELFKLSAEHSGVSYKELVQIRIFGEPEEQENDHKKEGTNCDSGGTAPPIAPNSLYTRSVHPEHSRTLWPWPTLTADDSAQWRVDLLPNGPRRMRFSLRGMLSFERRRRRGAPWWAPR